MSVRIEWSSFWPMLIVMPRPSRIAIGQQLGGNDFVDWVKSRSPKVQIEILEDAPKPIQSFFYPQLSEYCVEQLGITPVKPVLKSVRKPKVIDNRTGRL